MEEAFEQYVKDRLDKLIEKSKEMKADILQFGRTAVRKFGTIPEWEEYSWIEKYENAEVTTKVDFTVRRTGSMLKSSPVLTTEGKE